MTVYLAYTRRAGETAPKLVRVYKKSSYQKAFNWLADFADTHKKTVCPGMYNCAAIVNTMDESRWLERWETE